MTAVPPQHTPRRLLLISFTILFLELAAIRWLNASVKVLAYFNNFILISCFLGLGLGCLLASRRISLVRFYAPGLFLLVVAVVFLHRFGGSISLPLGDDLFFVADRRYYETGLLRFSTSALAGFFLNVGFFAILGQELGRQLEAMANPLRAYGYDIGGSLLGVLAYAALAWLQAPPHVWYGIGALLLLVFVRSWRPWLITSIVAAVGALLLMRSTYPDAIWSPYYKVEVEPHAGGVQTGFNIIVDNYYIQGALDLASEDERNQAARWRPFYELPYRLAQPDKVLILGAGSGNEAIAALQNGATEVHAVEIDPVIAGLGLSLHPNSPYEQEGVDVFVDDARSYLSGTREKYDLVVMTFLDSQKQIAGMASLRLESFVYTVESFEQIRRVLRPGGAVVLNIGSLRPWIAKRVYWSLTEAFGSPPGLLTFKHMPDGWASYVYLPDADAIERAVASDSMIQEKEPPGPAGDLILATDNWPHLYLKTNRVPTPYLVILLVTMAGAALLVLRAEPAVRRPSLHFFFLGAGFMLLETRSVTQLALLFGATWSVNSIVFASILAAIFVTNYMVLKDFAPRSQISYALLFATLVAGYFLPFDSLVAWPLPVRLAAAAAIVGLPIAWASFVFSTSFRRETDVARVFGSNLLGAVFGGCLEYTSNVWGLDSLYLVALLLYAASLAFMRRSS